MRFSGLGVGHLEYKAHTVHKLTVEDEPNWSELCSITAQDSTAGEMDNKTDSSDTFGGDQDDDNI